MYHHHHSHSGPERERRVLPCIHVRVNGFHEESFVVCEGLVGVQCQGRVRENRRFRVSDCRKTLKQSLHADYEEQ